MSALLMELHAVMDDGTEHKVVADQRDIARWEIQDFGCPLSEVGSRMMLAVRWLAWHALKRAGRVSLSWDDFDAQCLEVAMPDDEEAGAGPAGAADVPDPGRTAPSEAPSSRSRRRRVNL